jgi:hypothetical protein
MKMRYVFQRSFSSRMGVIMATKKFQSQFAETPMD